MKVVCKYCGKEFEKPREISKVNCPHCGGELIFFVNLKEI